MSENDAQAVESEGADRETELPGLLVDGLARVPEKTLMDEARLAALLGVNRRTVRRMVLRAELPPPVRFAGRSVWISGKVIAHVEARADRAAFAAEKQARRISELSP